jgi:signal transduction histidine kinase
VFGRFAAGLRTGPGRWSVVTPAREAFPNPWQRRVLAWLALGFVLTAPIGYLFARRLTAPLSRFAGAARRFGSDPSAPLMQLEGPAEIGEAAHAFNDMHRRLKRFIDDRTAMVGAISHDLRTPLARMRFKLERADPSLRAALVHDLEQMEGMIASVLDFIRNAQSQRPRSVLDLASVIECATDDAAAAGGSVSLIQVERPAVNGDPVALQRLFANLLDNAVKYGGSAQVSVTREAGEAMVAISDRGPGIAPAELERVFEPFYRADASRNLDVGGMGLGLAVARSLAREHGGDVVLTSSGEGLTAKVWLPLAQGR